MKKIKGEWILDKWGMDKINGSSRAMFILDLNGGYWVDVDGNVVP